MKILTGINLNYRKNLSFNDYISFDNANNLIQNNNFNEIKNIDDLSIVSKNQDTLLHIAAKYKQFQISSFLLSKGLNPNIKNK